MQLFLSAGFPSPRFIIYISVVLWTILVRYYKVDAGSLTKRSSRPDHFSRQYLARPPLQCYLTVVICVPMWFTFDHPTRAKPVGLCKAGVKGRVHYSSLKFLTSIFLPQLYLWLVEAIFITELFGQTHALETNSFTQHLKKKKLYVISNY